MINPDIHEKVKKEEILSLISQKGSHLVMEQLKNMLESKTEKMLEELDYLKDRLGKADMKLKRTQSTIKELEPQVIQIANQLTDYQQERDGLAKETSKLDGIEDKALEIYERKIDIDDRASTVRTMLEKKETLDRKYRDNLNTKGRIEEELRVNTDRHRRLENDVDALTEKKTMLVSSLPEYHDSAELKRKGSAAEEEILKFKSDIAELKKQLRSINKKLPPVKKQADKKANERDALFARRNALREQLRELEGIEDREMLTAELDELKTRKDFLYDDTKKNAVEKKGLEAKIVELFKLIEDEEEFEATAENTLEELMIQKGEIDNAENVIKMINLNISVNAKFQEIVQTVTRHLGPLNRSMSTLDNEYRTAIVELTDKVKKGIG